jgi:hypothetical protein
MVSALQHFSLPTSIGGGRHVATMSPVTAVAV